MLTLAAIKENPDDIVRRLARKHFDAKELIEKVIETDKVRRATQAELDSALSQIKTLSSQIPPFRCKLKGTAEAIPRKQLFSYPKLYGVAACSVSVYVIFIVLSAFFTIACDKLLMEARYGINSQVV